MGNILYRRKPLVVVPSIKYGALYNGYVINDIRNIANTGWKVPSIAEWTTLRTYLGGFAIVGGKLKETGTTYWNSPNTGATNEVGFNLRGCGLYGNFAGYIFVYLKEWVNVWSSTDGSPYTGTNHSVGVGNTASNMYISGTGDGQSPTPLGFACTVYLINEATPLSHGQTGTYTGNDGTVYPTICIGTQEYTALPSKETKYRTGDFITLELPAVSRTVERMYYYNDDINNV